MLNGNSSLIQYINNGLCLHIYNILIFDLFETRKCDSNKDSSNP